MTSRKLRMQIITVQNLDSGLVYIYIPRPGIIIYNLFTHVREIQLNIRKIVLCEGEIC